MPGSKKWLAYWTDQFNKHIAGEKIEQLIPLDVACMLIRSWPEGEESTDGVDSVVVSRNDA